MESEPRPPSTDSPWFWVLAFSLMALLALVVIGPKYGLRQSAMDRKYQARLRIEEQRADGSIWGSTTRNDKLVAWRQFATPGDTLVPLWPLAVILLAIALTALVMLLRSRARTGSQMDESAVP